MNNFRKSSLDKVELPNWKWECFFTAATNALFKLNLKSCYIPESFLDHKITAGTKLNPYQAHISTWACTSSKIRKARAACLTVGDKISVLNFVITPNNKFELPFFGADFVTLPNGHLLALDLQPALKDDEKHTAKVWDKLLHIHNKWQPLLPAGGPIPKEAEQFFSPGLLWTRIPLNKEGDQLISNIIRPAFNDYLSLYLNLLNKAEEVSHERSLSILNGQKFYMEYRAIKDPARTMLIRFYGEEWTEQYIHQILFDLR